MSYSDYELNKMNEGYASSSALNYDEYVSLRDCLDDMLRDEYIIKKFMIDWAFQHFQESMGYTKYEYYTDDFLCDRARKRLNFMIFLQPMDEMFVETLFKDYDCFKMLKMLFKKKYDGFDEYFVWRDGADSGFYINPPIAEMGRECAKQIGIISSYWWWEKMWMKFAGCNILWRDDESDVEMKQAKAVLYRTMSKAYWDTQTEIGRKMFDVRMKKDGIEDIIDESSDEEIGLCDTCFRDDHLREIRNKYKKLRRKYDNQHGACEILSCNDKAVFFKYNNNEPKLWRYALKQYQLKNLLNESKFKGRSKLKTRDEMCKALMSF